MPLTTSTMRAAALMPLWVYFHFSPGSYCIGAASQSGTRSASVFAFCASGPLASPSPEVCVRICVIVRLAGLPEGVFRSANPGKYFATGSAMLSLPSSCNMRIAAPVTGFVIEAIQKSVSDVIGLFAATSAKPVVSRWRSLSFVTTTVTAPAISFFAIISCIAAPMPGSFGPSASAGRAAHRAAASARMASWRHGGSEREFKNGSRRREEADFGAKNNSASLPRRLRLLGRLLNSPLESLVFIVECCPARAIDLDRRFDADLGVICGKENTELAASHKREY